MNELNDLRTRGVETWCQMKKVGISDEEAHREKENEKAKVETWNWTQKEMSDEEAHCEKETEKVKKDEVGTWSQMQEKWWRDNMPLDDMPRRHYAPRHYAPRHYAPVTLCPGGHYAPLDTMPR